MKWLNRLKLVIAFLLLGLMVPAVIMAATTAALAPQVKFTAMDNNGDPYVGGKLYTYITGTTTAKTSWTDSTKTTPNTSPIILDSRGQADVWIDSSGGEYRFRLKDAYDVTIWTRDGVSSWIENEAYVITNYNIRIGTDALKSITTGAGNVAVGHNSLYSNLGGNSNTGIGTDTLRSNAGGNSNTALGQGSLYYNTEGDNNIAVGYYSLYRNTTGASNTAVGYYSLNSNTTGINNTALGHDSLINNTTGNSNTAVGYYSSYLNTTGVGNIAVGYQSLYLNSEGDSNVAVGYHSLYLNTTGDNNTAIGHKALSNDFLGGNNIALGAYSGRYEDGSNAFYVNNQDRSNTAGDRTKSLLYGVMAATTADQKLTVNGILNLSESATPTSAADTGTRGDIVWDTVYIYVCIATDTWKRAAIATW